MINNSSFDDAILSLIKGHKKFRLKNFVNADSYHKLVNDGQRPQVMVIACCDSRVDPAIVTNCNPGELFVVRNIANLIPPFSSEPLHHGIYAALEFGVLSLEVSNIIVFGHSQCGGIRALMEPSEDNYGFNAINSWMGIAEPVKHQVLAKHSNCTLDEQCCYCEKQSLLSSLCNLQTFPWVKQRILDNKLCLHAWYFDMNLGVVEGYNPTSDKFVALD